MSKRDVAGMDADGNEFIFQRFVTKLLHRREGRIRFEQRMVDEAGKLLGCYVHGK